MAKRDTDRRGEVLEKTRHKTDQPKQFQVLLHNDDYTSMDFVVEVLETIFSLSPAQAYRVMMHVHTSGTGVAGVYTFEVAETKVAQVHDLAKEAGYPLRASFEEV